MPVSSTAQRHLTYDSASVPKSEIVLLLERQGFRIRGRRADCIHCEGHSRLTVSFSDEVAYCLRCHWTANIRTLSHKLGISFAPRLRRTAKRADWRRDSPRGWSSASAL